MSYFGSDQPAPRDYGQETRDTLQSQIDLGPQLSAANLESLNTMLGGIQNAPTTAKAATTMYRDPQGNVTATKPPSANTGTGQGQGGTFGALLQNKYKLPEGWTQIEAGQTSETGPPHNVPGLIDTYTGTLMPALSAATATANTAQRTADIADVANLGPGARAAVLAANPQNAQILDLLNQQAITGLQAGTDMTDEERRQNVQATRAAYSARGTVGTNQGIGGELISQYNLGQQLLRARQQFATGVVGTNQSTFDPMMALTGRQSGVVQNATGFANGALESANQYNPESAYAGNLYNANNQMNAMFADPSTMSKIGAVSNTVGSFIGSIAGGFCWVAREVYGEDNPQWLVFRYWLIERSPRWFTRLYVAHGEVFAKWLHNKPRLKAIVRRWMDKRITPSLHQST